MTTTVGGPMFEPSADENFKSVHQKAGAHYNIFAIKSGMPALRQIFPDGEANELNFVLFSTSGVHGMYTLLEEIEASLTKYGADPEFPDDDYPDDWHGNNLTVLIVQPRIVCLRYGAFDIALDDIPYLKKLRESSRRAMQAVGWPDAGDAVDPVVGASTS